MASRPAVLDEGMRYRMNSFAARANSSCFRRQLRSRSALLGPWGTTRTIERRFGYPPPSPRSALVAAIEQLEDRISALEDAASGLVGDG